MGEVLLLTLALTFLLPTPSPASVPVPVRNEATGLATYIAELHERNISSVGELMDLYGGRFNILQRGIPSVIKFHPGSFRFRYLYSPKWGWVDLQHFSASAWTNSIPFVHGLRVLELGEQNERDQESAGEWSRWDYEDLISNLLGVCFQEYLDSLSWFDERDFVTRLQDYLYDLGFSNNPNEAPNWGNLFDTEDRDDPAENRHYSPAFTTQGQEAFNEKDREILKFIKQYQDWMGRDPSQDIR